MPLSAMLMDGGHEQRSRILLTRFPSPFVETSHTTCVCDIVEEGNGAYSILHMCMCVVRKVCIIVYALCEYSKSVPE